MPRLAATLAGLALVAIPSAIAMAGTDTSSPTTQQTVLMRQMIRSAPSQAPFRGHRHCHHLPGDQQNGTSSGTSGV